MNPPLANGRIVDWSRDQYDADTDRERSTRLKSILKPQGPRAYYLEHLDPRAREADDPNDDYQPKVNDLTMGVLFHELILDGEVNFAATEHRRGTKDWKRFVTKNRGKTIVSPSQERDLWAWREALFANKEASRIIESGGFREQVILWEEEVTFTDSEGVERTVLVPCKAAYDNFAFDSSIDCIKTTRATSREEWEREIEKHRYLFSAGFYHRGRTSLPELAGTQTRFRWIALFKGKVPACYVFEADRESLALGDHEVQGALKRVARCRWDEVRAREAGADPIEAWPDDIAAQTGPISPSMRAYERAGLREAVY